MQGSFQTSKRGSGTGRRAQRVAVGAVSALALMVGACSSPSPLLTDLNAEEQMARDAAVILDALAQDLDQFGTISISSPGLLVGFPGDQIQPINLTPEQLLADPKTQGFSHFNRQQELLLAAAARVRADQVPLPTPPEGSEGLAPLVDAPTLPEAEASRIPAAFTPALAVPDPAELGLTRRQQLLLAKDDQVALAVANLLASPNADGFGSDKLVYAAVMTVALRPGRETYRGHIAEIEISGTLAKKVPKDKAPSTIKDESDSTEKDKSIERADKNDEPDWIHFAGRSPQVFGVFPGLDSQILDLRGSERRLLSLIGQIEGTAPQAGAQLRAAFRNLRENDRATLEARNTVIGYNSSGFGAGWRFTPKFTAQSDPAARDPEAANRLFPQSFPALVFFMVDKSDVCIAYGGTSSKKDCADGVLIRTVPRWLSAPDAANDASWNPLAGVFSKAGNSRLSEVRATDWGLRLNRAFVKIKKYKGVVSEKKLRLHALNTLAGRFNALTDATIGSDVYLHLPKPKPTATREPRGPAISSVSPAVAWVGKAVNLVVSGRGFLRAAAVTACKGAGVPEMDGDKPTGKVLCAADFMLAGETVRVVDVSADGTQATLAIPAMKSPPAAAMTVTMSNPDVGSAAMPAAVAFTLKPPVEAKPKAGITVARDAHGNPTVVQVEGNPPAKVFDAIQPNPPAAVAGQVTVQIAPK